MSDWNEIFGRPMIFDKAGQPITREEWARLKFDAESRKVSDYARIGLDEWDDVRVSTVWLGMDHQFGDGPPLIFETMVFGGPLDDYQWRYVTEAEAIAGHDQVVAKVRDLLRRDDGTQP
jgi:hypothetical protein